MARQGHSSSQSPRERLLDTLDAAFPKRTAVEFLTHLDDVDKTIVDLSQAILVDFLGRAGRVQEHTLGNLIVIDGSTYILKVRPDVERDRMLHVILQDSQVAGFTSPKDYLIDDVSLGRSVGKYDTLHIAMPIRLGKARCERAQALVVDIFSAGYFWLEERVRRSLEMMETGFEQDTLQLLRRELFIHAQSDLSQQVWLVLVENGRVQYAMDADVSSEVLNSADKHAERLQQGPGQIASALLANSIPLGHSFSREAIERRETIDMQLEDTPYNDVGEDFRLAQGAIYSKKMSLTPLAGDRKRWLLAAYPTSIRPKISDALDATSGDLDDYLSSTRTQMRPAVDRLKQGVDAGRLGEFAGRFVWSLIEGVSGI